MSKFHEEAIVKPEPLGDFVAENARNRLRNLIKNVIARSVAWQSHKKKVRLPRYARNDNYFYEIATLSSVARNNI